MKAIVILRDGRRFECDVPDLSPIEIDPPWDDEEKRLANYRLAIGAPLELGSRHVAVCYRSGNENGVPVFRER